MPRACKCPYWIWGDDKIHCQGGRLVFPAKASRKGYMETYCASVRGWQECSIAKNLMKERSDNDR